MREVDPDAPTILSRLDILSIDSEQGGREIGSASPYQRLRSKTARSGLVRLKTRYAPKAKTAASTTSAAHCRFDITINEISSVIPLTPSLKKRDTPVSSFQIRTPALSDTICHIAIGLSIAEG